MAKSKVDSVGEGVVIQVMELRKGRIDVCLVGERPLILNRMSEKAKRQLLLPRKMNRAEQAANLKHDPLQEFAASAYLNREAKAPTLIQHLASSFHGALSNAALDHPGAAKTQIARLTWVEGDRVDIYGLPKLFMAVTRSADIRRTPDIRTRMIIPEWACRLSISFMRPLLNEQTVVRLLAAAGYTQGVGDWRNEKGKGTFGQFRLCTEEDADYKRLTKGCGRVAQRAAFDRPEPYDDETAELLTWWGEEVKRRGQGEGKRGKGAAANGYDAEPTADMGVEA